MLFKLSYNQMSSRNAYDVNIGEDTLRKCEIMFGISFTPGGQRSVDGLSALTSVTAVTENGIVIYIQY